MSPAPAKKFLAAFLFCAAAALCGAAGALAAPGQVILIRHAEKQENGNELNAQGFRRAEALVRFFGTRPEVNRYGPPYAVYAAAPKHEDSSVRSIQTVAPLAAAYNLEINTSFTSGQTHKIAVDIMENPKYRGRLVVICWQHTAIVDIVRELAEYSGSGPAAQVFLPSAWPDKDFDRAWLLDFYLGRVVSFKDIPQRLLPGDSEK